MRNVDIIVGVCVAFLLHLLLAPVTAAPIMPANTISEYDV